MYESPIEIVFPEYGNLFKEVQRKNEEEMMTCIQVETGLVIDKEELIRALRYDRDQYEKGYADGKKSVNHGRWKTIVIHDTYCFQCSACNSIYNGDTQYCPHCGTKMDGGANDDD